MPSQLKFRGCKIQVTHAPEPDEIVWENLEVKSLFSPVYLPTD